MAMRGIFGRGASVAKRLAGEQKLAAAFRDGDKMIAAQQFLEETDRRLRASNFLYSARRREKVLGPLRLWRIADGAWEKLIQAEVERRGTGEAQYKHPALVSDAKWLEQFQPIDRVQLPAE